MKRPTPVRKAMDKMKNCKGCAERRRIWNEEVVPAARRSWDNFAGKHKRT